VALIDTRRLDARHELGSYDVCVVGAGAAGIYVAHRLAERGTRVLVLEAGGQRSVDGTALGIQTSLAGSTYRGASLGRAFGLGGTTRRWGGQLVPYLDGDAARAEPHLAHAWRHVVNVVARQSERVRSVLGLRQPAGPRSAAGPFARVAARLRASGVELVASDILPFRRRDLSRLLRPRYPGRGAVDVCLHAMVRAWVVSARDSGARIEALTVRAAGRDLEVRAPAFLLAAGALESARILLEIEAALPVSPFRGRSIGRGLSDHLSCTVARVPARSAPAIGEWFAPRFESGHLRSARLLEAGPPTASPRGFFHFIFERQEPAFDLARQALEAWQTRRWPELAAPELAARELGRSLGGLAALAWGRVVRARLHVPRGTPVHLQLDIEQAPCAGRGVSLGGERDGFDRRVARLDWDVSPADLAHAVAMAQRFARAFHGHARELSELELLDPIRLGLTPLDAFHPTGLCRLGADDAAVVDLELRVRGLDNLWALSTGVFPSAGSANPVLGMLCLGEELTARLAAAASRARGVATLHGDGP
jgi:glycine/D-amino acid oxidase-like deaminating enzyme